MYARIVVCLALDHGISEKALQAARQLLDAGGSIVAVHVHEPPNPSVRAYLDEATIENARQRARDRLAGRLVDAPDVAAVLLTGQPARAINAHAAEIGADCIVLGSHKPGFGDYLIGSTAARVVRHAPCAVHVLR